MTWLSLCSRRFAAGLCIGLGLFLSGCLQTSMLPAEQVDRGDVVVSGGVHAPTFLYIPAVTAQTTYGVGGGDVTANVGGSVLGVSGGLGGQAYLGPSTNLRGQGRILAGGEYVRWVTTLGLQDVPRAGEPVYYGLHVGAAGGDPIDFGGGGTEPAQAYPLVGATVGLGHIELGGPWRMQIELQGNIPLTSAEDIPAPPGRISVGVFRYGE